VIVACRVKVAISAFPLEYLTVIALLIDEESVSANGFMKLGKIKRLMTNMLLDLKHLWMIRIF
jgi:hypothetical protein